MPKRLGSVEIIRILEAHGFTFVSQRGSHIKMRHVNGHSAIIPHPRREIPIGTTRSIIRQAGLTPKDFGF